MTKQEVDEFIKSTAFPVIEQIAKEQSKHPFSYLDEKDLEQEIWRISIEALHFFDPERGELEHWLRKVVSNRLKNVFNTVVRRIYSPCSRCDFGDEIDKNTYACLKFGEDVLQCKKKQNYENKMYTKRAMMSCASIENVSPIEDTTSPHENELYQSIIEKLPEQYTEGFMMMASGHKVTATIRKNVRTRVKSIISRWED